MRYCDPCQPLDVCNHRHSSIPFSPSLLSSTRSVHSISRVHRFVSIYITKIFPVSFTVFPMPALALINNNSFLDDLFISHPVESRTQHNAKHQNSFLMVQFFIFALCAALYCFLSLYLNANYSLFSTHKKTQFMKCLLHNNHKGNIAASSTALTNTHTQNRGKKKDDVCINNPHFLCITTRPIPF